MNRLELAELIATKHELTKAKAARILATITETIVTEVRKGRTVGIVGFGTFRSVKRAARKGFNPRAGKAIRILASTVPKFVAGSGFKAAVDPKAAKRKAGK